MPSRASPLLASCADLIRASMARTPESPALEWSRAQQTKSCARDMVAPHARHARSPDLILGPSTTTRGSASAETAPHHESGIRRSLNLMRDSPGLGGIRRDRVGSSETSGIPRQRFLPERRPSARPTFPSSRTQRAWTYCVAPRNIRRTRCPMPSCADLPGLVPGIRASIWQPHWLRPIRSPTACRDPVTAPARRAPHHGPESRPARQQRAIPTYLLLFALSSPRSGEGKEPASPAFCLHSPGLGKRAGLSPEKLSQRFPLALLGCRKSHPANSPPPTAIHRRRCHSSSTYRQRTCENATNLPS